MASGSPSDPLSFKVGSNTFPMVVKAANGVTKSFTLSVYRNDLPVISGLKDTTISINDDILFKVDATDAQGIKRYIWDFNGDGINEDTTVINSKSHVFPATPQTVNVIVTVEDNASGVSKKAIAITVFLDPPIVNVGNDTTALIGHALALKGKVTDKYGPIALMEWSIGGGAYRPTSNLDTIITTPTLETPAYLIVLRATDNDGNVVSDTSFVSVQKAVFEPVGVSGFTSGPANYTSMAINGAGVPYMAYQDVTSSKATVMRYNAGTNGWVVVGTAGFSPGAAESTTLAISSTGVPYVAFKDGANRNKCTVMKLNTAGTGWELVGSAGFTASEVSFPFLALNGKGVPYVTFMDYQYGLRGTVMSYNSDSTAWVTVGTSGFSLGRADDLTLSFNSTNVPFVAYSDVGNGNKGVVKKLNGVGTGWDAVGTMEFSLGRAFDISLALSGSGEPYVAFEDGASGLMATVMRPKASGPGWEVVGVNGFSESSVPRVSLAFDKTGVPFVAYQDSKIAGRGRVMKLNSASTGWEVVGAAGFASGSVVWVSLKFDSAGVPYVGYHDTGTGRKASVDKIIFAP